MLSRRKPKQRSVIKKDLDPHLKHTFTFHLETRCEPCPPNARKPIQLFQMSCQVVFHVPIPKRPTLEENRVTWTPGKLPGTTLATFSAITREYSQIPFKGLKTTTSNLVSLIPILKSHTHIHIKIPRSVR